MVENKNEVEIDLLELGKKLWDNKKFIIKCSIIGAIVGLIIAFSIPKEYTSTVVFTTVSNKSSNMGNMGALASMAGISLGGAMGDDILAPELYPEILKSTPFIQGLFNFNVIDENQEINTSYYNYLRDHQKNPWWISIVKAPRVLLSLFGSSEAQEKADIVNNRYISKEESLIITEAKESIEISANKKTGIITLDVTTQSPSISASLADTLTTYLQLYLIEERTKKARNDLSNALRLYKNSQTDYEEKQLTLARFLDRNKNITLASFQTNQKKMEHEVNLAFSMYNQMAQQVQIAEIKVQNDTPVFTIIQPAIEPLQASKPSKKLILFVCCTLSVFVSSIWILRTNLVSYVTNSHNETNN